MAQPQTTVKHSPSKIRTEKVNHLKDLVDGLVNIMYTAGITRAQTTEPLEAIGLKRADGSVINVTVDDARLKAYVDVVHQYADELKKTTNRRTAKKVPEDFAGIYEIFYMTPALRGLLYGKDNTAGLGIYRGEARVAGSRNQSWDAFTYKDQNDGNVYIVDDLISQIPTYAAGFALRSDLSKLLYYYATVNNAINPQNGQVIWPDARMYQILGQDNVAFVSNKDDRFPAIGPYWIAGNLQNPKLHHSTLGFLNDTIANPTQFNLYEFFGNYFTSIASVNSFALKNAPIILQQYRTQVAALAGNDPAQTQQINAWITALQTAMEAAFEKDGSWKQTFIDGILRDHYILKSHSVVLNEEKGTKKRTKAKKQLTAQQKEAAASLKAERAALRAAGEIPAGRTRSLPNNRPRDTTLDNLVASVQ